MRKWLLVLVTLVAMAAMVVPGSAYFQVWHTNGVTNYWPNEGEPVGYSDVRIVNQIPLWTDYSGFDVYWRFQRFDDDGNSWPDWTGNYDNYPFPNVMEFGRNTDYPPPAYWWDDETDYYEVAVGDWSTPSINDGYYADEWPVQFENFPGQTTWIMYVPEYDPFAYMEYYGWDDRAALFYNPGPIFPSPK